MIQIWKRPNCAYCPMVMKYLDRRGVPYTVHEAEGENYKELYKRFGVNVPLIYNTETDKGTIGYNIGHLNELIG